MVQVWSPMSQLQRSPEAGVWYLFDKSKRIAIVRVVEVRGRLWITAITVAALASINVGLVASHLLVVASSGNRGVLQLQRGYARRLR